MSATCPRCQRPIPIEDLNVASDVALCRPCAIFHKLSALVQPDGTTEPALETVDLSRPPAGAWYRSMGASTVIGASHRSLGTAMALLFFCLFWNGIVSVFVGLALSSTMRLMGLPVPAWFPAPIMNGGSMGVGITIGLWIFLTPFILIGLVLVAGFLSALGGRTEITIQGGAGVLFGGIGPLGRRRRFQVSDIRAVRIQNRVWRGKHGGQGDSRHIELELQTGKPLRFGSGLGDERMQFVAAALRRELSV